MEQEKRIIILLLMLLIAAICAGLSAGQLFLSWHQILSGLLGDSPNGFETTIMCEIRLPRVLLAILAGASLGMAGAALQGLLRNPLADPSLLGVTNGAGLGAVLAIYGGFAAAFPYALPAAAITGALIAVFLVGLLAKWYNISYALILAGIAVSSLLASLLAFALNLASDPFAAMEVIFWLMGSFEGRSLTDGLLIMPLVIVGILLMMSCRKGLDVLTLGEETATSLGISLPNLHIRIVAGIAFSVGAVTAISGSIGFIGLVVPHILRLSMGAAPGRLLVPSALGGALLVLLADMAVRIVPTSGMELRLSVITALVGTPVFIALLFRNYRRGMI